jgi:hypothetical protein
VKISSLQTLHSASLLVALAAFSASCDDDDPPCDTSAARVLCTIAGSGQNGYDRDADTTALPALGAKMALPQDTLTAPSGEIYILDWNNHRLRRLSADGQLHWVAGRGELGGSIDDPAYGDFNHPTNIIFDETGEKILIAAWHNSKVRILDPATGLVQDTCGDGRRAYFGDGGDAMTAALDLPASLALSPAGELVIMDQANQVLRRVDKSGQIHLMAGKCMIDAAAPAGPGPCADGVEPVLCPESGGRPSGKYTCGDPMVDCARPCTPGYGGDDGPASELRMSQPFGQSAAPAGRIAYNKAGELYFADTANNLIRKIDAGGIVRRVAGLPPEGGAPQSGYSGDGGPALAAKLNFPVDLAFGDDDTLYFTDVRNHCVRAIDSAGVISTVVGRCGEKGFEGDGGAPEDALLNLPFGVEWRDGVLLISDTGNNRIRQVKLR